jgi:hypothetical protein
MDCFATARNDDDGAHGLSVVIACACDKRAAFAREQSDEAIRLCGLRQHGLLRFARNDN